MATMTAQRRASEHRDAADDDAASTGGSELAPSPSGRVGATHALGPIVHMPTVQTKLTVGQVGDRYEREADMVAERVSSGAPAPQISRIPPSGLATQRAAEEPHAGPHEATAQSKCEACAAEDASPSPGPATVQAKCASCDAELPAQRSGDDHAQMKCSACEAKETAQARHDDTASETHQQAQPAAVALPLAQAKCEACGSETSGPGGSVQALVQRQEDADGNTAADTAAPSPQAEPSEDTETTEVPRHPDEADLDVPDCNAGGGGPPPAAGPRVPAGAGAGTPDQTGAPAAPGAAAATTAAPGPAGELGCGVEGGAAADSEGAGGGAQQSCGAAAPSADADGGGGGGGSAPQRAGADANSDRPPTPSNSMPACADPQPADHEEPTSAPEAPRQAGHPAPTGPCAAAQRKTETAEDMADNPTPEPVPDRPTSHSPAAAAPPHHERPAAGRSRLNTGTAAARIHDRGAGEPLPHAVRARIEASTGVDFGAVRVHADSNAHAASKALRAKAFTHRNHIFLGAGHSQHDVGLMAHEATHVLQQNAIERRPPSSTPAPAAAGAPQPSRVGADRTGRVAAPGDMRHDHPAAVAETAHAAKPAAAAPAKSATLSAAAHVDRDAGVRPTAPVDHSTASDTPEETTHAPAMPARPTAPAAPETAKQPTAEHPAAKGETKREATTAAAPSQAAPAATEAAAPAEKSSPESDARFQGVIKRLGTASHRERSHVPPGDKVKEAKAAVKRPDDEPLSEAQTAKVDTMAKGAEQAPPPKVQSFEDVLQARLDDIRPKNMEQTLDFKDSGAASSLKGAIVGEVKAQKTATVKPLQQATDAQLKPGPNVKEKGLEPEPAEPGQRSIHPEDVLPEPKSDDAISVERDRLEANQMMADNDIDEDQLRRANEPQFTQVIEAKKELDANCDKVPEVYRKDEHALLTTSTKQVGKESTHSLGAMRGKRQHAKTKVRSAQDEAKRLEEQERLQVVKTINDTFRTAQTAVKNRLDALDAPIGRMFDTAEAAARQKFEDYVDRTMSAYKRKRYKGVRGKARWLWDKITDLPGEVNQFYVDGTKIYMDAMKASFHEIAVFVDGELAAAKIDIDKAKCDIQTFICGLKGKQKTWGENAFTAISGDFEALEASVEDKKQSLANDLTERYRKSREQLDERIEDLKAQNRGLGGKFKAFVRRVVEILKKLKDLAMTLLRVGGAVLRGLMKDPTGFLGNLIDAIKLGFGLFADRIGVHLKDALVSFVTGSARDVGITPPSEPGIGGLSGIALQILGVAPEQLKAKVAAKLGVRDPSRLEQAWTKVKTLFANGASALWDSIKQHAGDILGKLESEVKEWIGAQIVKAGLAWIVSLFTPASALLRALKMIYDVVTFFLSNLDRIIDLVNGVLASINNVVMGNIAGAAKLIESALAKGLAFLLGFLASLLGLSGIGDKIVGVIRRVRNAVDRAIDAVLNVLLRPFRWIVSKGGALVARGKAAVGRTVSAARRFLLPQRAFSGGGESHRLFFQGEGPRARLMIASDTKELEAFVKALRARPENKKGASKDALDEVDRQLKLITKAKGQMATNPDSARAAIDAALSVITAELRQVLSADEIATKENPLPLDYPKHASAHYPKVYLGPLVGADGPPIDQDDLKKAHQATNKKDRKQAIIDALPANAKTDKTIEDWEKRGMQIEEADPHGSKTLAGGEQIGVQDAWRTYAGRKLQLPRHDPGGTPGGKKINAALAPYGFRAKAEGLDGDHVVEIQIGGQDLLANLWPLDKSENRGAGSLVKSQEFPLKGGGKISMDALKQRARARNAPEVWLVITKTR